jgi:hypothetical protein
MLTAICGRGRAVNAQLLAEATMNAPNLIIDCANCADPHAIARYSSAEALDDVHIIEVDLIYKFRDVLLALDETVKHIGAKKIIITTFDKLFNYQDKEENTDVYLQIWLLLRRMAATHDIIVGVREASAQEELARKYAGAIQWDIPH